MTLFVDDGGRRIARRALNQADEGLDDLEELQLRGIDPRRYSEPAPRE